MSDVLDRVEALIALEKGEIKTALQERRHQIELATSHRLEKARTDLAKVAIKAQEAQNLAELEAWAYQAELNAQAAQEHAKELRQQAGHYTKRERFGKAGRKAGRVAKKAVIIGGIATEAFGREFAVPVAKGVGRGARAWYKDYHGESRPPKSTRKSSTKKKTASKRKTVKRRTRAKAKK